MNNFLLCSHHDLSKKEKHYQNVNVNTPFLLFHGEVWQQRAGNPVFLLCSAKLNPLRLCMFGILEYEGKLRSLYIYPNK